MAPSARGWQMIEIVTVLVALCFISVVLRIVARLQRRVGFGVDDYLSVISMVLMIAMLIELGLWCSIGGNGAHVKDLDADTLMNYWKIFLANQFTYFLLCPAIKISIICFYRRVFTTPRFQSFTFGLNCLIGAWGTGIFLACAGQCRPLRAYWDHSVEGQCFDANLFFIVNQAFNVLMDFVILVLPVPMIWNLHRAWQDKLALNGVFALGAFVCFASIYRIVVLFWISPSDPTYTVYQATLWTHVEPSVGLICSCLPIIRGLFPALKLKNRSNRSDRPYYINTDLSNSNFLSKSSPRSPDLEYMKMEAGTYGAQIERMGAKMGHGQFLGDDLHPLNIKVQTDIAITPESGSNSSENGHIQRQ
ncbi:integral membrane protein [Penicillium brasilianum]|uniref:Integral membrane protein n=1 Tax=Penicillium brasilianum TaxID=104259 RepID=A0A1S9RX79_PENBI|nr:integral membrane protein [Penicillium brasilianum]